MNNYIILLFDGECNLCNKTVQFVIKNDKKQKIKFAALNSENGKKILNERKVNNKTMDSIVLVENNNVYFKSTAAIRLCKYLSGIWPIMFLLIVIPPFIRNFIYNYIAKKRYKWFGKAEYCWIMTPEHKKRFEL